MIKKIKSYLFHPLFIGSAVMIIGSNFANVIAYFYHLILGRMLGPDQYGELSSIISLLGLFFTSFNFLGLVIVKFVSSAKEKDYPKVFSWFSQRANKIALGLFVLMILISLFVSDFLKIKLSTIILIAPILYVAVLAYVYRSFLQGLLKFKNMVIAMNLDLIIRLIVGVILVYLGFSVFGATVGIVISNVLSYLYLCKIVSRYKNNKNNRNFNLGREVLAYSLPIFVATVSTNLIISVDILLVKHFFSAHDAGIYASLSTLSKIIFYGVGPISAVMFPIISRKKSEGKSYKNIFILSSLMVSGIAILVLLVYLFLPNLSINILYGEEFLEGSDNLLYFAVFMAIFSLCNLFINLFMSLEETKVSYFVLTAALGQIIGIWFFHESIRQVISVSMTIAIFLLIILATYFININKNENKK